MNIRIENDSKHRREALRMVLHEWKGLSDKDVEDLVTPYRFLEYYSAFADGKFVGLIELYAAHQHPKEILFIGWFIVHPDYREHGIGSKLIGRIEKVSRARKVKYLYVVADKKAVKFYIHHGYRYSRSEKLKKFYFCRDCELLYKPLS